MLQCESGAVKSFRSHRGLNKPEGVVFIGKAQEKTPVFRTERRRNPQTGSLCGHHGGI
jgi:hypothetical protein